MPRKTFTYEGRRYDVMASTESELNRKIVDKKRTLKRQSSYIPRFAEWFDTFLETYKNDVADRTYKSYINRAEKHYLPVFGKKKITDIRHSDCQKFFNHLKGYSGNTIHKLYHDLHQIFDKAIVNEYITTNPVHGVILPKGGKETHRSITPEERCAVHTASKTHYAGLYMLLMLYCGIRPHEASYIQGKDVEGNRLHIRGTKTVEADRYVPIPDVLIDRLKGFDDEEYIIKSSTGISPVKPHHRNKMWRDFKSELEKYMDVPDDLVPYCLRHTYCTDLQDAGVPITVAKHFMGHSTITLTANIYSHQSEDSFTAASGMINSHINCVENVPLKSA